MRAVKEIREERDDVYSFWEDKKFLNENDEIVIEEVKIEESTLKGINDKIIDLEKQIVNIQEKINKENDKLFLISKL